MLRLLRWDSGSGARRPFPDDVGNLDLFRDQPCPRKAVGDSVVTRNRIRIAQIARKATSPGIGGFKMGAQVMQADGYRRDEKSA